MSVVDLNSMPGLRLFVAVGPRWRAANWGLHAAFMATFSAFLVLYAQTFASLIYTWAHAGTFEYAFLIFPVCTVLVWTKRASLRGVTVKPSPRALCAVLILAALWLLGALADINVIGHFCIVALIPVLVYCFYGPEVTRVLAFPLGYMFFAVPFGDFMVGPLQDITAHLSVFALKWTDVPVFMSGRIILTPASAWHVAEACSGVKFFIATTAFGVLYAHLFFRHLGRRLVFVACAMVVPVIANGLRVFFTILIGEHFGLEYATGTDHLIFGWQFFGTVLLLLFLAGWPWHEFDPAVPDAAEPVHRHTGVRGITALGVAAACILVLAIAPGWIVLTRVIHATPFPIALQALPPTLGSLAQTERPSLYPDPGVNLVDADARSTAYYGRPDVVRVDYARYDGTANHGRELITAGNDLFDASVWQVDSRSPVNHPGAASAFAELELQSRQGRVNGLLWYVYGVNGHLTTSPLHVKAWEAWYALQAKPVHSSVIVLSTEADDIGRARSRLIELAPAALALFSPDREVQP